MKNLIKPVFVIAAWLSVFAAQAQLLCLTGKVSDEAGVPLPGAVVVVHELMKGTSSDTAGNYIICGIKPGKYHIHLTLAGYHSYSQNIVLKRDTQLLNFVTHEAVSELHEVIIETNPLKQNQRESSVLIEAVDENFLNQNSSFTLSNSLEKLPGINAINTGVGISKPVIRGLSHARVAVTDQGVKQEGQQWGSDHGLEIDAYGVEGLEIIKGPGSLVYGSDALGGVLSIRRPEPPNEDAHEARVKTFYRSVNHTLGANAMVKGRNKNMYYRANFTEMHYGDYRVPADKFTYNRYILNIVNQQLKNTAGRERNASASVGITGKGGYSQLTVSNYSQEAGIFAGAMGIPTAYQLTDDGNSRNIDYPKQQVNHFKVISNSNLRLSKRARLELDWGYQHNKRQELSLPHSHGLPVSDDNLALQMDLHTLSGNSRLYLRTGERSEVILGMQNTLQQNAVKGFELLIPGYRDLRAGLYALHKYTTANEKWNINAGIRLDGGRLQSYQSISQYSCNGKPCDLVITPTQEQFQSPAGSVGLSFSPTHQWNFKANAGRSFRYPSIAELKANGMHHGTFRHEQGNDQLKPETGWQYDASAEFENKRWMLGLVGYYYYFDNYIFLRPTGFFSFFPDGGQLYRHTQTTAAVQGIEAKIEYKPAEFIHIYAQADAVYAHNIDADIPLPFTPAPRLRLETEWHFDVKKTAIKLPVGITHTATQHRTDRNEPATSGYTLLYAGISGTRPLSQKYVCELHLRVDNIMNTQYMNHLSRYRLLNLPEPGRNFNIMFILRYM